MWLPVSKAALEADQYRSIFNGVRETTEAGRHRDGPRLQISVDGKPKKFVLIGFVDISICLKRVTEQTQNKLLRNTTIGESKAFEGAVT